MLAVVEDVVEEMEIPEAVDKDKAQIIAPIAMYQSLASPPAGRNISRSHQTLRKKGNSRKRPIPAEIRVLAKRTVLHLILPQR